MKKKPLPGQDKWSLKPPDHNAQRVRENQRRHRARAKTRMEELETRLAETNAQLQAALATIGHLTAQLEDLRSGPSPTAASVGAPTAPASEHGPQQHASHSRSPEASEDQIPPYESPADQTEILPAAVTTGSSSNDMCDCENAPPPATGESTIACSSAFQIIEQQNVSGLAILAIQSRLKSGFRCRAGEACRVETTKLYDILDHITTSPPS